MADVTQGDWTVKQDKTFAKKVQKATSVYKELDRKLSQALTQFLIAGADATCLLKLDAAYKVEGRKRFFKDRKYDTPQAVDRIDRKTMMGLFEIQPVPPGYFCRLGEFASHIPEVKNFRLDKHESVPDWLHALVCLRALLSDSRYYSSEQDQNFSVQPILADLSDTEQTKLIDVVVRLADSYHWTTVRTLVVASDWSNVLAAHSGTVAAALRAIGAREREQSLNWLCKIGYDFGAQVDLLVEFVVGSSKVIRPIALRILRDHIATAQPLIEAKLREGQAAERRFAAEALAALAGKEAEEILKSALENEKGKRVRQTLESLLLGYQEEPESEEDESESELTFPKVVMPEGKLPLPKEFEPELWRQLELTQAKQKQQYEKQMEIYKEQKRENKYAYKPNKPATVSRRELKPLLQFMSGETKSYEKDVKSRRQLFYALPVWSKWNLDLSEIHLLHVLRFMCFVDFVSYSASEVLNISNEQWLTAHREAQISPYSLRELDAAFAMLPKFSAGCVAECYLQWNGAWRSSLDWEAEAVWPLFIENKQTFRNAILGITKIKNDYWVFSRRATAMSVAAMLPHLPRDVENAMWSVALGENKTERPAARRALHSAKNKSTRVKAALEDGKQGIRIAAAEMAAELDDASLIESLKKALKKEKQELVKGSLLQAIEALGGEVEEFLGRRKQLLDAKKGLEKKRPKGMEWVQLDRLPRVRWAEDGKAVNKEIVQWWLVQSIQFKLPVCGVILRRSIEMCNPQDAAQLARHVLADWITFDTKMPTRDEVLAEATKQAKSLWNSPGSHWMKDHYGTEEKYREYLCEAMQENYLQSAIGQKGMLALVAAAGDSECVKLIERYIRKHHGNRLAQSKALLETLAWIDHPLAVQFLLSLGNRFRTKAIRQRAEEIVKELAERQGWTMDQLGDRTIPDAGFVVEKGENNQPIGQRPELVLDYGSRKFSVILGDDLQAVISREDGKQVKSLPAAAKDDDADLVKAAKKEFSSAKKTIKEVVKLQAERLYEATCAERSWPASEWKQFLFQHPIAGALCRRVVWAAKISDEGPLALFRPLEDGTLTDVNDDEFQLDETASVLVAHSSQLDEETETAWKQHLEDYEVPELFQQFGRETYRLPEKLEKETEIMDFQGHMLTTFRLRSKATKLGWARGDIEDGGSFAVYHKPFRSKQISAVLEFSGSYVPEEDIPAALHRLYFVPMKDGNEDGSSWNPNQLKLSQVPPVLLSECFNDMRDIAAEGTGFDKDWQSKGLW